MGMARAEGHGWEVRNGWSRIEKGEGPMRHEGGGVSLHEWMLTAKTALVVTKVSKTMVDRTRL